jgi:hypothetical protein
MVRRVGAVNRLLFDSALRFRITDSDRPRRGQTMRSVPDSTPLPRRRAARRSLWKGCLLGAIGGGVGGPAFAGIVTGAVFILKRAGQRVGWFGVVLEAAVFGACAVLCGLELLLLPLYPVWPWLLARTVVGLFGGATLGAFVGWAVATQRE